MRVPSRSEVMELHLQIISRSGGMAGLRDPGMLDSALAQPFMTFDGEDLYPSLADKAAALAFSLINNHPFVDGNKRIGHAAMEVFLVLNGHELNASVDEQESIILQVASGVFDREAFTRWVQGAMVARSDNRPA
jgi:death on curing protein